ncbi:MAG TPA: hypothetical protein VHS06_11700, partial [Chloroflexota bacterium]|nr:hypothetical protein [Chloroflexota bacterium]
MPGRGSTTDESRRLREAIGSVALEMASELDWDRAVEAALRVAESSLNADAIILWTTNDRERVLELTAQRGRRAEVHLPPHQSRQLLLHSGKPDEPGRLSRLELNE